ncbi:MAG: BACON domain-containing protein [Bacteroidales bacterium]|nr:BACON domain-containing protein [Bacteroidales bacterium]
MKKIILYVMIASMAIFVSCKKDTVEETPTPTLEITPASQSAASVAGSTNYAITSNSTWTVVSDQSWCIVTAGGVNNGTVVANYTENTTTEQRVATITVTVTGLTPKVVTLTQGSMNSVAPLSQEAPTTPAGKVDFTVSASSAWTASSDQDWCTVTASGTGNGTIEANYTENTSLSQRSATITVNITGVDPITVTLTQAAAASLISVEGEITGNVTWTADRQYLLKGFVYVVEGAVLTIEPGTVIKGDKPTVGALIVERGGKLIADGTASNPIVFTSNAPAGFRNRGDWGGIVLCGKAPVNNGDPQIEGGPRSHYGGAVANDNSGVLRYVRIEYGGYPLQPDKEINGLTLAGVGSGTVIDYVMVAFANDDSFEWFGGTVNAKHLIAYRGLDDDFDTDNGFSGKVQYALAVRDKIVADVSGSNGFESDNDAAGSTNSPITKPIFSNVTHIGPRKDATTNNISANYKNGLHLRRNTQLCTYNSLFAGNLTGLLLDGTLAQTNAVNGDLQIRNSILAGPASASKFFAVQATGSTMSVDSLTHWYLTPSFNNDTVVLNASLKLADAFNLDSPNATPLTDSPLLSGADFSNANLQDAFFTPDTFIGAFGSTDWTTGWVVWNSQNMPYTSK